VDPIVPLGGKAPGIATVAAPANPPDPPLNNPLPPVLDGAVIVPVSVALLQLSLPKSVLLLVLF
jgi:hypothetical protein